jgi:ATP-dependent Clp protease ATP-binding subunit ClpA
MISPSLEKCLYEALQDARRRRNEYFTLEHILLAMIRHSSVATILERCGADPRQLDAQLDRFIQEKIPVFDQGGNEPQQTLSVQRVLQRAAAHAQSSGRELIDPGSVLASLFNEEHSYTVFLLKKEGITRLDILQVLSHDNPLDEQQIQKPTPSAQQENDQRSVESPQTALEKYTVDLVEKAKIGLIDPLIGRDQEIRRVIQILCRRKKNNPLLVGDPGVGKTAIAEGLALKIAQGEVPEVMHNAKLFALDMGGMLANTKFRGDFEARVKAVIQGLNAMENAILFIDEIHTIVGAGATSGGTMDASNLLKPLLASGELRCMGSTTYEDYKASLDKDRALARRFQKIDVAEPTIAETIQILEGLKPQYESHHKVKLSRAALEAAATLSAKHLTHKKLPDKAIDVIDEVGAAQNLLSPGKRKKIITLRDVEQIISEMARIPPRSVSANDRDRLQHLARDLKLVVYGQDQSIEALVNAIQLSRSGLREEQKTIGSFLFTGPTGVGKTEIAKQLARILGIRFIRFDMSEYMEKHAVAKLIGAPPGYVGFEQGGLLTDAVNQNPYAVLLLDEIEKAHPDVFNILLQVMDNAALTDQNGKTADFRNIILIMTSNAGAKALAKSSIGFHEQSVAGKGKEEIERLFSPEFRNRLDAIIHFNPLDQTIVEQIVEKFLTSLQETLSQKKVDLTIAPEVVRHLARTGFDPKFGARPLARKIDELLKQPLAQEILFGSLTHGGSVRVEWSDEGLVFITPPMTCMEE